MTNPRSLRQIVDHQLKRWEVEHRAQVPRPGGAPCVALSRQHGSGADAVGRQVASWLDYGFFGIEIVDQIAKDEHVQRELVADLDEHIRDAIHRYVIDSFHSRTFSESDYLRALVRAITTLGERGMAVILGRGAAYILPQERCLRVLLIAPRSVRVERFAKEHGIAISEASERVEQEDAIRREFLQMQFGVEPDDPTLYDLVVNTANLDVQASARVIIEALRRRFPSPG